MSEHDLSLAPIVTTSPINKYSMDKVGSNRWLSRHDNIRNMNRRGIIAPQRMLSQPISRLTKVCIIGGCRWLYR